VASLNKSIIRKTELTANDINKFLSGTPMAKLGDSFIAAEAETGIGADYWLAIACHESGKGTGGYAKAPWYNLFSWGIHDSETMPVSVSQFKGFEACIARVPPQIKAILDDTDNWRNTKAKKLGFIPSGLSGIGCWYAKDSLWAQKVEGWRQVFIQSLDPNQQTMFWASDVIGMYNEPTKPNEPVTRLTQAYALRKALGGKA
jgi:hypothetical protein